jgi:hypothetical protein
MDLPADGSIGGPPALVKIKSRIFPLHEMYAPAWSPGIRAFIVIDLERVSG